MGIFSRQPALDYRLGNAEAKHRENPRSFFIPSRAEREGLRPGDLARLLFEVVTPVAGGPGAERMWVSVTEVRRGRYAGELTNQPGFLHSVQRGSRIEFGPEHVISVIGDWPAGKLMALVSRRSQDQDLRPGFVTRAAPSRPEDSGWQVLVGDESPAELEDTDQILLQPLRYLTDRWPELRAVFDAGEVGSDWAWHEGSYVELPPREDG